MSSITPPRSTVSSAAAEWFGFERREVNRMLHEDLQAGWSVSLLLTAIVFTGLLIGLTGVLLAIAFS